MPSDEFGPWRVRHEMLPGAAAEPGKLTEADGAKVGTFLRALHDLPIAELAAAFGLGVRQLQRLFAEYVGVRPKWVIRRHRLHEVAACAAAGGPVDLACSRENSATATRRTYPGTSPR